MILPSRSLLFVVSWLACAGVSTAAPTSFASSAYPATAKPRAIVAADFNRDGRPDLATGGTGSASIGILINDTKNGGGFLRRADIPVGGGPFDIAAGDLNGDERVDLVIANADSDAVTILFGRGDGSFTGKRDIVVGGNPRGIAIADVTGDGRLDILVTQYAADTWTLLIGDGAGGITPTTTFATAAKPQGIVVADLNRDGLADVVVASTGARVLSVFYGAGGRAASRRDTKVPVALNVLTTGDFNRDGWGDVAGASTDQSQAVVVLGSATGLGTPLTLATGSSPRGIVAADMNQDGRLDLAVANRASSTVTVQLGRGDGTFAGAETLASGSGSRAVVAADFDRDGRVDLATADEYSSTASYLDNVSTWITPGHVFAERLLGDETGYGGSSALQLGDFDEDGRMDAATIGAPTPLLFFGNGRHLTLPGSNPASLVAGDVDGDGHLDLVTTDFWQNTVNVYRGNGRGAFSGPDAVQTVAGPQELELADFNRDGHLDIVTEAFDQDGSISTVHVLLGSGDGRFTQASTTPEVVHSNGIAVGDFNRDGRVDLVTDEFNPAGLRVRYGDGAGGWSGEQFVALPDFGGDVRAGDVNGDGRLDLVVPIWTDVVVLLANDTGFNPPVTYTFPEGYDWYAYRVGLGDVDLDGDIDIVTNYADLLVNQGDGTFVASMLAGYGDDPQIADFTGDGIPDVLLSGSGWLRVLVGERNETNRAPAVSAGPDLVRGYEFGGEDSSIDATGSDPDQHDLRFEWRDGNGHLLAASRSLYPGTLAPGTYTMTVTAFDDRGGTASDSMTLTITPYKEIYAHPAQGGVVLAGGWSVEQDPTAADGWRMHNPDAGGPKLASPSAQPLDYFEFEFKADPTQAYKLWIRGKADRNSPYNDSVFVQFTGAVDAAGNPTWQIGTNSALTFNLEECSGCGLAGWGWEDDGWGARNANGGLIRFPEGGWQRLRIQTREDGLSIDQIVLSSQKYVTTRPGTAKDDKTILPITVWTDD